MFLAVTSWACQPTEIHPNTQPPMARQTRPTPKLLGDGDRGGPVAGAVLPSMAAADQVVQA